MQINLHEIGAIQGHDQSFTIPLTAQLGSLQAFHLPKISPDIPLRGYTNTVDPALAALAQHLLAINVIDPMSIPDHASTLQDVVEYGLAHWIGKRVPELKCLLLSLELKSPIKVAAHLEEKPSEDEGWYSDPYNPNGNYALALMGTHDYQILEMEAKALRIEAAAPGLFKAAFDAVKDAGAVSVEVRLPDFFLDEYLTMWTEWGAPKIPTDKSARECLLEHFGDESEEIDAMLPSAILPTLGGDLCISQMRRKYKRLTNAQLKDLSATSDNLEVTAVADMTLKLRRSTAKGLKAKASLPNLDGISTRPYETGCTLVYRYTHGIHQRIDEAYRNLMEVGDGHEMLGLEDLPRDTDELTEFFVRLDHSLMVLQDMDTLINLISTETGEPQ